MRLPLLACLLLVTTARAADKPNIIVVLADDLGAGDLGCYNKASKIPTPNFDKFASQGMRFTDSHSPSGVCTPTRYGLLTGRYSWRGPLKRGVLQGYDPLLIESGRTTLASLLKQHGYATAGVGKWHLGLGDDKPTDYAKPFKAGPNTVGFDHYFGIPSSLDFPPYVYVENDRAVAPPTEQVKESPTNRDKNHFWRAGGIAPGFKFEEVLPKCTEKAIAFLEKQAKDAKGKPFFLYYPLSAPHTPWMTLKQFEGKSKAGNYGDFVAQVDDTLGQLTAALDRLKLADSTLVIVTSDNGAHWLPQDVEKFGHSASNGRRGQKSDAWEGGHRVPFLVRWPGKVKPGSTSDELICHVDLLATCADLIGAKLPDDAGEDSESILPVLLGKEQDRPIHEAVIHHSGNGIFAIRQGQWKLIEGLGSGGFSLPRTEEPKPGGPKGQLYKLAKDPEEKENVYLKEPETVKALSALLEKYRQQGHSARRLEKK